MNGQAAAYSSRCRIGGSVTVTLGENGVKLRAASGFSFRASGFRKKPKCAGGYHQGPRLWRVSALAKARKPKPEAQIYFAASCAHFASVVRNGFAAGGGATSPFSKALKETMRS